MGELIGDACSAQGALAAGRRYVTKVPAGSRAVMRHTGAPGTRWWLIGVLPVERAHDLYWTSLLALQRGQALAVWEPTDDGLGHVERFGEHFTGDCPIHRMGHQPR